MTPFLALITPLSAGEPTHPIAPGGGPSTGPGFPTHPIAPGGPPPGIWPSPGYPAHPIAPGGPPPGIWPSPGYPSHPIAGPPPGIWPSPGYPSHPIAPGGGPSQGPGFPTNPIVLPPDLPETLPPPDERPIDWKVGWLPTTGWVVIGVPTVPVPTPS
jgi:hypothetical protein